MTDAAETVPPPEEPKMEIHKPHAAKTWREFFIELGTIVLGILIALSLEQAVEKWREHRQYNEARDAMRAELSANLSTASWRPAITACIKTRLAEIATLLDKAEAHQAFDPPSWVGQGASFRLHYAAENGASRTELFSTQEQAWFSALYGYFHSIDVEQEHERQAWARLQALEGRMSVPPEMMAGLRQALAEARYEDERIQLLLAFLRYYAREDSLQFRRMTSQQPQAWPGCVPMNTPRDEALRRIAYPGLQ